MNVEDIKSKYSMADILSRYNLKIIRGFCKCPFHKGDRTPSMKIYKNSFYCFGCGVGGDIITFVQQIENVSFEEACKIISGEELTRQSKQQVAIQSIKRKEAEKKRERLNKELREVTLSFTGLWSDYLNSEPFSDKWCNALNKWQLLCYKQDSIVKELGDL